MLGTGYLQLLGMPMRYWATWSIGGNMMHPCALVYDEESNDDEDSDDDNDSNGDGDSPPDIVSTSYKCSWSFVLNGCLCPQLQPLKCTFFGCDKLVHQHCQNAFEQRDGHSKTTLLNAICTFQTLHLLLQNH